MEIILTRHCKERMLQRDTNLETIELILEEADFVESSFDERKIASKFLEKWWHVVFKKEGEKFIVISVYFS
jgi:hypothetical protein